MGESLESQAGAGLGAGSREQPGLRGLVPGLAEPALPLAGGTVALGCQAAARHRGLGSPRGSWSFLEAAQNLAQSVVVPEGWAHAQLSGPAELTGHDFYGCVTIGLKWTRLVNNRVWGVCIVWRVTNSLVPGDASGFWCLPMFDPQCLHLLLPSKHWDFSVLSSLIIPILFFFFTLFSTVLKKLLGP